MGVPLVSQTRLHSLLEQVLNVGSGFVISTLLWQFVIVPLWGIQTGMADNLKITSLFTLVSVIRGYAWRRWFNARVHKALSTQEN